MGIVIYPQELKNSLSALNASLETISDSATPLQSSIAEFSGTQELKSIAFVSEKEYMNSGHLPAINSIVNIMEQFISTNNSYINYIDAYLSDETYWNENLLELQVNTYRMYAESAEQLELSIIANIFEEKVREYQSKLNQLHDFLTVTSGLYQSVEAEFSTAVSYVRRLEGSVYNKSLNCYFMPPLTNGKNLQDKKMNFLNSLPAELSAYVSYDDIELTEDGFFMITKSMKDIFIEMGLSGDYEIDDGEFVDMFDDWYISGIIGDDEITYTLIKLREPTDEQEAKGSAVPFIALDMDTCLRAFDKISANKELTSKDKENLCTAIHDVIYGAGEVNRTLLEYFRDPKSEASYLIADIFVNKVVNGEGFDENGVFKVPTTYEENDKYCKTKLDELGEAGIYNKEDNTIQIKDKSNLTEDDFNAILVVSTGNPDIYSYAAENQYHAIAYNGGHYSNMFGLWNKNAIVSDAGVGESKRASLYEDSFKDKYGDFYREQKKEHEK